MSGEHNPNQQGRAKRSEEPGRAGLPLPASKSRAAWIVLVVTTLLGLVADLATKETAFRTIAGTPVSIDREAVIATRNLGNLIPFHKPVVVMPNVLDFTLVLNPGAVFGIGAGKRWFFVLFTAIAVVFATGLFARWTRAGDRWAHIAIGLVISGGLGNLYDRLLYACVRDFIHPLPGVKLPFGWSYPWATGPAAREVWPYVSNLADLWLIIGIVILVIHTWKSGARADAERAAAS
ncbi:MAG: signal peptidase II [Phycisphaerales bacterium]|nr:signal peptidase II [Phycisphaerales bacterium]